MKKAGRGSAVDHEPPLPTGAIERHLSTAGTVRPRRGSRGVATFGRDAAFTIPLIRKRRSTLLLDPPMAASGHEHAPKGRPPDGSNAPNAAVRSLRSSYRSRPKAGARLPYSITSS